jgi:hypothetical protein
MANIQNTPRRAKQRVLDYLKSRGGTLRCGPYYVHQVLFWKCFETGNGSDHYDIAAMKQYLLELEADGDVVLHRDDNGMCRCITLSSVSNPETDPDNASENELSCDEIDEVFARLTTEYATMQNQLAQAKLDAAENLQLATEYEATANAALREKDAALLRLQEVSDKLANQEAQTDFGAVRRTLVVFETKFNEAQAEKDAALATIGTKQSEIERLQAQIRTLEDQNAAKERALEAASKKNAELSQEFTEHKKTASKEIADLKREILALEKGDGLTASKAAAAVTHTFGEALFQFLQDIEKTALTGCDKYLPEGKVDAFHKDADNALAKIRRRNGSK